MIFVVLIFALILRLINLNQSLWLDEAVQAVTAQKSFGFIFQELSGDFHPPLYHFLMHFWVRAFGSSEVVLRMPSVLFGVGTIYLVWKIGRLSNLRRLSYLGALFLATAPFHIYYSQEARMYSLATFLTAGSVYFFLRILEDNRRWLKDRAGIGYFIFTLLALYTDYYVFLVLLAQNIFLLTKRRYKFLFFNTFLLILCYLPWLPMFVTQIKVGMLATKSLPEWGKLVNVSFFKAIPLTLVKFTIGRITIFDKKVYGMVAVSLMAGYSWLMIKGVRGWLKETKGQLKNKLGDVKGTIIIMWFFVPLLISWVASLFIPNFQPFRLLLILPAFYLILAMGIEGQEGQGRTRWILTGAILLINLISLSVYYFNPYFQREDWKGVVEYIKAQPDSIAVLPSETSAWPIDYYDPRGETKLITVGKEAREMGEVGEIKGDRIYYIRYLVPLFDPKEKILQSLSDRGYNKTKEISFNQIPLWEFEKK